MTGALKTRRYLDAPVKVSTMLAGRELTLEVGRVGTLADAVVLARYGSTTLLASAVSKWELGSSFMPLQVDYREKAFGAGTIPGTATRRETGMSDRETLAARVIDRTLRPLFPKGYNYDTQLIVTIMSFDEECDPVALSIIAASAALHVSDIPWYGPAAAVRVGWRRPIMAAADPVSAPLGGTVGAAPTAFSGAGGDPLLSPSDAELDGGPLDLLYCATEARTLMLEIGAEQVGEADAIAALRFAHDAAQPLLQLQDELRARAGRVKRSVPLRAPSPALVDTVRSLILSDARRMYGQHHFRKADRGNAQRLLQARVSEELIPKLGREDRENVGAAVDAVVKEALRGLVLDGSEAVGEGGSGGWTMATTTLGAATTPPLPQLLPHAVSGGGGGGGTQDDAVPAPAAASETPQLPPALGELGAVDGAAVAVSAAPAAASSVDAGGVPLSILPATVPTTAAPTSALAFTLCDAAGARPDGRASTAVRAIVAEVDVFPAPVHGSALFSRGDTQVVCTATLGPVDLGQLLQPASLRLAATPSRKPFFLHYDFPPYSTNEVGKLGGLNRRMVGHGALAEKALLPLLPPLGVGAAFPYSVRVTSEVSGSDGSSSMATVCGASLALQDAGVPMKAAAAGISIGLVSPPAPRPPPRQVAAAAAPASAAPTAMSIEVEGGNQSAPLLPLPATLIEPVAIDSPAALQPTSSSPLPSSSFSPSPSLLRGDDTPVSSGAGGDDDGVVEVVADDTVGTPLAASSVPPHSAAADAAIGGFVTVAVGGGEAPASLGRVAPPPDGFSTPGARYVLLTDIFGLEDHAGDMDFKVAGTAYGITAAQLDIKPAGVPLEVLEAALWRARAARLAVLDAMSAVLPTHRPELKAAVPRVEVLSVTPDSISKLVGPGGSIIRRIQETTGARVLVDSDTGPMPSVSIYAPSAAALATARSLITIAVEDLRRMTGSPFSGVAAPGAPPMFVGTPATTTVMKALDYGVVLGVGPHEVGWMHISEFTTRRVGKTTDVLCEGDTVTAQVVDVDARGKAKFSMRVLCAPGETDVSRFIVKAKPVVAVGAAPAKATAGAITASTPASPASTSRGSVSGSSSSGGGKVGSGVGVGGSRAVEVIEVAPPPVAIIEEGGSVAPTSEAAAEAPASSAAAASTAASTAATPIESPRASVAAVEPSPIAPPPPPPPPQTLLQLRVHDPTDALGQQQYTPSMFRYLQPALLSIREARQAAIINGGRTALTPSVSSGGGGGGSRASGTNANVDRSNSTSNGGAGGGGKSGGASVSGNAAAGTRTGRGNGHDARQNSSSNHAKQLVQVQQLLQSVAARHAVDAALVSVGAPAPTVAALI